MNTDGAGMPGRWPAPQKPLFPPSSGYFRQFGFFLNQADQAERGTHMGNGVVEYGSFGTREAANRLFPQDSTQVVDFPHLGAVRVFRERPKQANTGQGSDAGDRLARNAGDIVENARTARRAGSDLCEKNYGLFGFPSPPQVRCPNRLFACAKRGRVVTRSFTKVRTGQARKLASQARHELDAQMGRSLARNVVAIVRIVTGETNFCGSYEERMLSITLRMFEKDMPE